MRAALGVIISLLLSCSGQSHSDHPSQASGNANAQGEQPAVAPSNGAPASVVLSPPGHEPVTVEVEVAADDRTRQRGLMYRRELGENAGMIFVFDEQQHLSFWMHNTYLPLDMIFIREDMGVLGVVENATPETDDPREVRGDSKYVLEVNAGFARRHGIGPGTQVRFVNVPLSAAPRGAHAAR